MRQAHGHFIDSGQSAERLLDCAGTEGAVEAADACANLPAVWPSGRFLAPGTESRGGLRRDIHPALHAAFGFALTFRAQFGGGFACPFAAHRPKTWVLDPFPATGFPHGLPVLHYTS